LPQSFLLDVLIDTSLPTPFCPALSWYPIPEIHHSDQGVQYAANDYVKMLEDNEIEISMAGVGKAYENGHAERLMRTIKEEEVDLSEYRNFNEVYERIEAFLEEVYMKKRIHSSLRYLTPSEFEEQWRNEQSTV
jgi:putative transposase